jgi:urease accessory protein
MATDARHLAALLQLASPALPVGAFCYSQGLERAVHDGYVHDGDSTRAWIFALLKGPVAHFDAPVWWRLHHAWRSGDATAFGCWNERYVASRESAELRAETLQMGASFVLLAVDLGLRAPAAGELSFPAAFAAVSAELDVRPQDGLTAFVWTTIENQVAAAIKAVPLGQVAGQRILLAAHDEIAAVVAIAATLEDDELASAAPGLALASALHETQYSRLFRS